MPFFNSYFGSFSDWFNTRRRRWIARHGQKLRLSYWRSLNSKGWLRVMGKLLAGGLMLLFVFYLSVYFGLFGWLPTKRQLKAVQNNMPSEVYTADSVLIGRYFIQDRTNVAYDQIAEPAIKALIATEDVRFYEHDGVDYRSLARVFIKSLLLQEESSGGGSTLSQQLAKNLFPRKSLGFLSMPVNKLREAILARRFEAIYSKEEILGLYLNTVPMGGNVYGIESAARRFFNTSADSLKTEEAAVLIGLLKGTTSYHPKLYPERSKQRRNVVLAQMAKYGYLTPAQKDSLQKLPLELRYNPYSHHSGLAPYFREHLREELGQWAAQQKDADGEPYNLYTDGLKIYTTLDSKMQRHAELALKQRMKALQIDFDKHWGNKAPWTGQPDVLQAAKLRSLRYKRHKAAGLSDEEIDEIFKTPRKMQVFRWRGETTRTISPLDSLRHYLRYLNAGFIAMEPKSGFVRAWVGGINHNYFQYDHVRSRRQVGSTFKPIVYATALEKGIAPCSYFSNDRRTFPEYENWSPRNADDQYGGSYSMLGALSQSINTVSVNVALQAGLPNVVQTAHSLGITGELPSTPSLALGTADASLLEMVAAYAALANGGYQIKPRYLLRITDRQGTVLLDQANPNGQGQHVLSSQTTALLRPMLENVVQEGTGRRLRSEYRLKMGIAGKTGTTQSHADGWFIGFTPELVAGAWVGGEDRRIRFRDLEKGGGANTALPIWGNFFQRLSSDRTYRRYGYSQFAPLPAHLRSYLNCPPYQPPFVEETVVEEDRGIDEFFKRSGRKLKDLFKRKGKKEKDREKDWQKDLEEKLEKRGNGKGRGRWGRED
ncbi:penicillin-binding protein 1A [Rufibacter sediminis]|uniref:Transglycosylase domain-containing protein n=1 Tax=Rufibacter sediminis TaxID=2762756 RepID=A0ABR6VTL9_9BACT|nr:transglycosylase domain-containing protein [Rufibacter sediminis]MBC3539946.1 transglycosylase domain-containing protein [Rufibacter sediminis]